MTSTEVFIQARNLLMAQRKDHERACARFQWPQLENFNWALDWFDAYAKNNNRPALRVVSRDAGEIKLSFRELSERSNQVANFLRGQGVRRGDPILLMVSNVVAFWEVMLATIKLGAVVIPATTMLTREDLLDRIERGGVRHVVTGAGDAGKFADIPGSFTRIAIGQAPAGWQRFEDAYRASPIFVPHAPTPANAPLLLYFTSGTTAKPKLVEHSHVSYPVGHLSTMYWLGLKEGDVHLNISSPGWAKHAWSGFFAPWNAGATVFVYNWLRFNAKTMLDVIVRHGVTSLCAPPVVWRQLLNENLANYPVRLREVVSSGQPLDAEIIRHVEKRWSLTVRDGYGQTETTAIIGNTPGTTIKQGSMGKVLPGYKVALLDAAGAHVDEGEIALPLDPRPMGLMLGYQDDWGKTIDPGQDGWYRTGDVARRDADGYYHYVGRADDLFKSAEYRISPFELESVLLEHEAVAAAAVVHSAGRDGLIVPKAVIELGDGFAAGDALAEEVLRFTRARLAPYQRIRRVEFGDLPKTMTGKIRRVELRRREEDLRREGERAADEFWEEDFPTLAEEA